MDEFPELQHIRISNRGDGFQNTVARNGTAQQSSDVNHVGLSVFHENLNLSNIWYDYDSFYFGTEITKFLNNYQIFFKEFDENSLKTFTGWAAHKVSRHGI